MMSKLSMLRIIDVMIEGILSNEKNLLEAALSCCQCVGNCDTYSNLVLESLLSTNVTKKDTPATVEVIGTERPVNDSLEIKETCKLGSSLATLSSPQKMIVILLLLDSMMKGCDVMTLVHWFQNKYITRYPSRTLLGSKASQLWRQSAPCYVMPPSSKI